MKFGLLNSTIEKINSVWKKFPEIEEVIIYGSRANGNHKTASDIDIALKGKGISETILLKIKNDIDELNTSYFVDISIFEQIKNINLKKQIKTTGKTFYQK